MFTIRHLVIQIIGHNFSDPLAFAHTGVQHESLLTIWPPTTPRVTWPPPRVLDEAMLDALSKISPGRKVRILPPDPSQYEASSAPMFD